MKLWKKISLLTAVVLFLAMGIFGGGMLYETWKYNLNQTVSSYQQQIKVNAYVIAQEINNNPLSRFSEVTRKSFLNYTVQKYGGTDYILLKNGKEVVNLTGYMLVSGEEKRFSGTDPEYVLQKTENRHLLVMGQALKTEKKGNLKFQLILVKDISGIYEEMAKQMWLFILVYLVVIFFAVDIVFWLVRMVLKPLTELENTAGAISRGDWQRRCRVRRNDEIGKVSVAFNRMADKMEEQMEELETVSEHRRQLLGSLTHELKTPIALIQGYAEGLKEGINDDPESTEFYCDVIIDEAGKMNRMVKNLLTLNQLEFGTDEVEFERFDIVKLVKGVIASCDILIQQVNANVDFIADETAYVWADEFKTEQVVRNYLTNAIHHVGNEKRIEVKIVSMDGKVCVSVFNSGKPIPEEDVPKLWDKFYKVDKAHTREYGGNGIGLSIVKAIMESFHQGYGVKNYDNGVEFWFELDAKCGKV